VRFNKDIFMTAYTDSEIEMMKMLDQDMIFITDKLEDSKTPIIGFFREVIDGEHHTAIWLYQKDFDYFMQCDQRFPQLRKPWFWLDQCLYAEGEEYEAKDRGKHFEHKCSTIWIEFPTSSIEDFVESFAPHFYTEWHERFCPHFYQEFYS
jgi:hypothetical protein